MINGFKLTFYDELTTEIGQDTGNHAGCITFDVEKGERISAVYLFKNNDFTKCKSLRIQTNRGKDFWPKISY